MTQLRSTRFTLELPSALLLIFQNFLKIQFLESKEWADVHFPPDLDFWSQYLPDPDTNINTCMHFIYCSEWLNSVRHSRVNSAKTGIQRWTFEYEWTMLKKLFLMWFSAAVLNLLRLENHLQILSLGCGPPLKIVPWKIAKIGLCVFISLKNIKVASAREPLAGGPRPQVENCWFSDTVLICDCLHWLIFVSRHLLAALSYPGIIWRIWIVPNKKLSCPSECPEQFPVAPF